MVLVCDIAWYITSMITSLITAMVNTWKSIRSKSRFQIIGLQGKAKVTGVKVRIWDIFNAKDEKILRQNRYGPARSIMSGSNDSSEANESDDVNMDFSDAWPLWDGGQGKNIKSFFDAFLMESNIGDPHVRHWKTISMACVIISQKYAICTWFSENKDEKLSKWGCFWGSRNRVNQMYEWKIRKSEKMIAPLWWPPIFRFFPHNNSNLRPQLSVKNDP